MKRTPLKRSTVPMKRTALKRSEKPMKRGTLRQVSSGRKKVNAERARLQEAAWGPRPWQCRFNEFVLVLLSTTGEVVAGGRCFGKVDGHEILSRAAAGQTDENLLDIIHQVPLCAHHNGWCDLNKEAAKRLGLRISAGEEWDGKGV
jgi:hypothetical protein